MARAAVQRFGLPRLLRRLREKPVDVLARQIAQRLTAIGRGRSYWRRLDARFRQQIASASEGSLRRTLVTAPQMLAVSDLEVTVSGARMDGGDIVDRSVGEADDAVQLRFKVLGAELDASTLPVPWRADWRIPYEWPLKNSSTLAFRNLRTPYDVKYPWELSRFMFAPTLALAWSLTGDDRYSTRLMQLVEDWADDNPVGYSINWASPLEVAIRATHLAAALPFLLARPLHHQVSLLSNIAVAAAFVYRNLEYSEVRGNHYMGNLYGLITAGLLLRDLVAEAQEWVSFAAAELEREILLQFLVDGVNFEKSLPYHRFTTEMALLSYLVIWRAGLSFGEEARQRLYQSLAFLAATLTPAGTVPVWGDNDDANALHIADQHSELNKRAIGLGALMFRSGELRDVVDEPTFDTRLLVGEAAEKSWKSLARTPLQRYSFSRGGFLISSQNENYLLIDVGEVGLLGRGGHGHNDALSFELWLHGAPIIVDPGMPTYTGDAPVRNRFRSTHWHNTAVVDQQEQATLFEDDIWRLGAEAEVFSVEEQRSVTEHVFSAAHAGFRRFGVEYYRRLRMDTAQGLLEGEDLFSGSGAHLIELPFHCAPGVQLECHSDLVTLSVGSKTYELRAVAGNIRVCDAEVSPNYGVRVPSKRIIISASGALPITIRWAITPRDAAPTDSGK